MTKTERNAVIVQNFEARIQEKGYSGRLACEPIPNGYKKRQPYFIRKSDQMRCFSVFLWQLNTLSDNELQMEIDRRIDAAIAYFRREGKL